MSKDKIRAGKAEVELGLNDKTDKELAKIKDKFLRFASGIRTIGRTMLAAGAATIAVFGGITTVAVNAASKLQDVSETTGISGSELSALGYAASQTGSNLDTMASGLESAQRFTGKVAKGSKLAAYALEKLGISSADFLAATPRQRLDLIADGLASIQDQSIRSAVAMQIFGGSGADLIRTLQGGSVGLAALTQEARDLGSVLSDEQIAALDSIGDQWARISASLSGITGQIAASVAPAFQLVADLLGEGAKWVAVFTKNNQTLTRIIFGGAVALVAFGSALIGLASIITITGIIIGSWSAILAGIVSGAAAVGAAITAILSPIGILVGSIVGLGLAAAVGIGYFLIFTKTGQTMVAALAAGFSYLYNLASTTLGGMLDFLAAGDWRSAGEMAVAGLGVAFIVGTNMIENAWSSMTLYLASSFRSALSAVLDMIGPTVSTIINEVNRLLDAVGLPSLASGDSIVAAAKSKLALIGSHASKQHADTLKANKQENAAAEKLLEFKREQARITKVAAVAAAVGSSKEHSKTDFAGAPPDKVATLGTFSGYVANLLGKTAPELDAAQQTAENTAKTNDLLEELLNGIDDGEGGLAVVGG